MVSEGGNAGNFKIVIVTCFPANTIACHVQMCEKKHSNHGWAFARNAVKMC